MIFVYIAFLILGGFGSYNCMLALIKWFPNVNNVDFIGCSILMLAFLYLLYEGLKGIKEVFVEYFPKPLFTFK